MHHRQYQVSPRIVSTKAVETCSSDHCSFKFDFWRLLQAVSSHIILFKRFQRCGFIWSGGQAQLIGNCQDQVSFSPITVEDIYYGNFLSGLNEREKLLRFSLIPNYLKSHIVIYDDPKMSPTDPKCPSEI